MAGAGKRFIDAIRANLNDLLDRARERDRMSDAERERRADEALRDDDDDAYSGDPRLRKIAQAYANLELPMDSELPAVKSQYRKLMGRYHPDKHHRDAEKAEVANRLAAELTKAYDTVVAYLEKKKT